MLQIKILVCYLLLKMFWSIKENICVSKNSAIFYNGSLDICGFWNSQITFCEKHKNKSLVILYVPLQVLCSCQFQYHWAIYEWWKELQDKVLKFLVLLLSEEVIETMCLKEMFSLLLLFYFEWPCVFQANKAPTE